jgi:hemoglobin
MVTSAIVAHIARDDALADCNRVIVQECAEVSSQNLSEMEVYAAIGGEPTFRKLVDCFYAYVEADPLLRPMFPPDLEEGKRWQLLFLMQRFGGPSQYQQERGHPRLRMRHQPFAINQAAQQAWLGHMLRALDEVSIAEPARTLLRDFFTEGAAFMVNIYD